MTTMTSSRNHFSAATAACPVFTMPSLVIHLRITVLAHLILDSPSNVMDQTVFIRFTFKYDGSGNFHISKTAIETLTFPFGKFPTKARVNHRQWSVGVLLRSALQTSCFISRFAVMAIWK
jgi:hypothetical protein